MDNSISIIVVWALLGGVIVTYVIYRLVTDRRSDSKRHILYPLVSNTTDGMFPEKNNIIGWLSYSLMVLGVLGFLGIIYMESTGKGATDYLVNLVGVSFVAGLLLLGLAKLKKRWHG